jgi:hypothetical protein
MLCSYVLICVHLSPLLCDNVINQKFNDYLNKSRIHIIETPTEKTTHNLTDEGRCEYINDTILPQKEE